MLQVLEATRPGYAEEREWHRFLLGSYTGGGGYQGPMRQPSGGWNFVGPLTDLKPSPCSAAASRTEGPRAGSPSGVRTSTATGRHGTYPFHGPVLFEGTPA